MDSGYSSDDRRPTVLPCCVAGCYFGGLREGSLYRLGTRYFPDHGGTSCIHLELEARSFRSRWQQALLHWRPPQPSARRGKSPRRAPPPCRRMRRAWTASSFPKFRRASNPTRVPIRAATLGASTARARGASLACSRTRTSIRRSSARVPSRDRIPRSR